MNRLGTFKLSGIALALAAAFGPARAVEPIVTQNIDPAAPAALNTGASTASVGIGYASDDARQFGVYNGINEDGFYGLIDFNWVKRNDDTGTSSGPTMGAYQEARWTRCAATASGSGELPGGKTAASSTRPRSS